MIWDEDDLSPEERWVGNKIDTLFGVTYICFLRIWIFTEIILAAPNLHQSDLDSFQSSPYPEEFKITSLSSLAPFIIPLQVLAHNNSTVLIRA